MRRKRLTLCLPHTIPEGPWGEWYEYDVLQGGYRTLELKVKNDWLKIHYGLQDGIPVGGYSYSAGTAGGGCAPGRKWGEFRSLGDVITYYLIEMRPKYTSKGMLKLIDNALATRPGTQLKLFK